MHDQAGLTGAWRPVGTALLAAVLLAGACPAPAQAAAPGSSAPPPAAGPSSGPRPLTAERYGPEVVEAHRGQVLVVNFWATWCEPCREEMPSLASVRKKFPPKDVAVVLVSTDSLRSAGKVTEFLVSRKVDLPCRIASTPDPGVFIDAVDREWDGSLPFTIVYDRGGKPVQKLVGLQTEASFAAAIRRALAK